MYRSTLSAAAAAVVGFMSFAGSGQAAEAAEAYQAEIDSLIKSMEKYQDPYVAVRDGYRSTVACVHYSGDKMDGHVHYDKGAMGIHFLNTDLLGPTVDPMKPPLLVYEPAENGLRLVAVEYLVPLATGVKEPPVLFGQTFQGPMEGHEPLMPTEVTHYDLHLWIKDNPYGMFAPTNPEVSCEGYDFELLEHATKLVPHQ